MIQRAQGCDLKYSQRKYNNSNNTGTQRIRLPKLPRLRWSNEVIRFVHFTLSFHHNVSQYYLCHTKSPGASMQVGVGDDFAIRICFGNILLQFYDEHLVTYSLDYGVAIVQNCGNYTYHTIRPFVTSIQSNNLRTLLSAISSSKTLFIGRPPDNDDRPRLRGCREVLVCKLVVYLRKKLKRKRRLRRIFRFKGNEWQMP